MFGRTLLSNSTIYPTRVSTDGAPTYKVAGATIDWTTVTAPGSDTTLADGSIILSGRKYLRYGQVMCKITTGEVDTETVTATGGTETLTYTSSQGVSSTTISLAYNANAAARQAALETIVGTGNVTVTGTGPYVYTFAPGLGNVTLTPNTGSLTGGTSTIAETNSGQRGNKYGPYDPSASDGRQTLTRGSCFVLDETITEYGGTGSTTGAHVDQTGSFIEGGSIWQARVLQSGTATHTLALGPTFAEFIAAFPSFFLVNQA